MRFDQMNFSSIASIIKKDAPFLADVIATANPIAGVIVKLLFRTFGVSDENSLSNILNTDPQSKEKLQEIENQHIENLLRLSINDKADAREREEKIVSLTGKRDWVLDLIAVLFITFFFTVCILGYFYDIKEDHVMLMLIGQISAGVGLILAYYFGSSNK